MRRMTAVLMVLALGVTGAAVSTAQESRPGAAGGAAGHGGTPGQEAGAMGMGMMRMPGGMMGGSMRGGMAHLEHLMVHNPKAAARLMRFRADMFRAMSEVLQRHAAELDKAP